MTQSTAPILSGIEHIVVLMLENRSFDNILGWLYDGKNAPPFNQVPTGQTFDGVSGKNLTNPWDKTGPQIAVQVPVGATTDPTNPYPDPGEVYAVRLPAALQCFATTRARSGPSKSSAATTYVRLREQLRGAKRFDAA